MPGKVRCCECGYLAIRNIETRQLSEVEYSIRATRKFPEVHTPGLNIPVYVVHPICFRMESQFLEDVKSCREDNATEFFRIIEDDRACSEFTEWKHGWTPREHYEMDVIATMKLEAATEKAAREAADLALKKELESNVDRRFRTQMLITGCVGIASVFATVVASVILNYPTWTARWEAIDQQKLDEIRIMREEIKAIQRTAPPDQPK